MNVRRLLAGMLLTGLAVPTLGTAPQAPRTPPPPAAVQRLPLGSGSRVFARAESEPEVPPSAQPSPAGVGPAASVPSPDVAARARAVFEANRAGKIDRTAYSAEMNAKITDAGLARVAAELRNLGDVKSFVQVRKITMGSIVAYVFRIESEKPPAVEETISWDGAGKIGFLQFGPAR
jgi:hypothetical protein